MRFCPFCTAENADEQQTCAQCGRRLPPAPARRRNAPPTGIQLPNRPVRPTGAQPPQHAPAPVPTGSPAPASNFSQPVAAPQPLSPSSQYSVHVASPQTAPIAVKVAPDRESSPVLPPPPTTPNPVVAGPGSSPTVRATPAASARAPQSSTTVTTGGLGGAQPGPGSSPTVTTVGPGSSPTVATSPASAPTNPVVPAPIPRVTSTTSPPPMRGPATAHDRQALLDAISPPPAAQRRPAPPPEPERQAGMPARRKSDAVAGAGASDDFNTVVGAEPIDLDDPRLLDGPTGFITPDPDPPTSVTTAAARPKTASIPPAIPPSGPRPIPSVSRANSPSQQPPLAHQSGARPVTVPPPLASTRPNPSTVPPPLARATSIGVPPAPVAPASPEIPISSPYPLAPQLGAPPQRPSAAELIALGGSTIEPPPTRIQRPDALVDRPFTPPKVHPIPLKPEPGLVPAARYAFRFARARYQRRGAIKLLAIEIKQDTESLDQVLGLLGKVARDNRIEGRVFSAENAAISAAEGRTAQLHRDAADVDARKADENTRFVAIEGERNAKLADAERSAADAQRDVTYHEGRRRSLRDQKKDLERRQKAYLKAAEDADRQSSASQMGDARADLRRSAEQHRKEAAALEPERQDLERQLVALEKPAADAAAKLESAKAELDAAKRSLADAREGHTHRLDELDAEQKRKTREMGQADSEIARRLVTLGTLVNLNRSDDPVYAELYQRIDRLRTAITARTTESERLAAEREAYDRGSLVRGVSVIGGAIVLFIAFIVIVRACI